VRVKRRAARLLLVGAVVAALTVVAVQSAYASGYVEIKNFGSGMCVEVNRFHAVGEHGTDIVQRTCDGSDVQLWVPNRLASSNDSWNFINRASGMCLNDTAGNPADWTPTEQWECNGSPHEIWRIGPNIDLGGVHQIWRNQPGHPVQCLDVANGSHDDGATVQLFHCTGWSNGAQVWSFPPM
jgi:hypothetical protein